MKFTFLFLSLAFAAFIVITVTAVYPVALVGGQPILARTWQKAEEAAKRFTNANAQSRGAAPIDFTSSQNTELLLGVKRDTLTFLIEDAILNEEGKKEMEGFTILSRQRVEEALRSGQNLAEAAKLVYGLSLRDFRNIVLMPQARRDLISEVLKEKNEEFDEWLARVKKTKRVRLMFVPFRWDGEMVR